MSKIKLETGKSYITRDGTKTGPLSYVDRTVYQYVSPSLKLSWTEDGLFSIHASAFLCYDIIAEEVTKPCVYLAGPGVFRQNARLVADVDSRKVRTFGFEPLHPLDNNGVTTPSAIRLANEAMIEKADIIVANIQAFRGPHMDPGTAYEIGYARALGKPVFLYLPLKQSDSDGRYHVDSISDRVARNPLSADLRDFPVLETFGLMENLMITDETHDIYQSLLEALRAAAKSLEGKETP